MFMLLFTVSVFLLVLYFGNKVGGVGIAYAAGIGIFIYTLVCGIPPGSCPVNVVLIIITVIGALAALELAGGLDYLVVLAQKILQKNPKYINILAPLISFTLTVMVGTGHAAYSLIPVIVETAHKNNIKPSNPLSLSIVASQVAVTSSPIAAAIIAFSGLMLPLGVTLPKILLITLPSSILAIILVGIIQSLRSQDLGKYKNNISSRNNSSTISYKVDKKAKISVFLFLLGIITIIIFASFPNFKPVYPNKVTLENAQIIMMTMLSVAFMIVKIAKVNLSEITNQKTFKAGMSAVICIIGVAWLGDTLIKYYQQDISFLAKNILKYYTWLFPFIVFIIAVFLYSQVTTVVAIMPIAIALSITPINLIASLIAVNAVFILPTYPTVIAATQLDYTGSTAANKYIIGHPFLFPGILTLFFSITFAYVLGSIVL